MKFHSDYQGRLWKIDTRGRDDSQLVEGSPKLKPSKMDHRYKYFLTVDGQVYDTEKNQIVPFEGIIFQEIIVYVEGIHLLLDTSKRLHRFKLSSQKLKLIAEEVDFAGVIHAHNCWGTEDDENYFDEEYLRKEQPGILVVRGDQWYHLDCSYYHRTSLGSYQVGKIISLDSHILHTSEGYYYIYGDSDKIILSKIDVPDNTIAVINQLDCSHKYGILTLTSDGRFFTGSIQKLYVMDEEVEEDDFSFREVEYDLPNLSYPFTDLIKTGSKYYVINQIGEIFLLIKKRKQVTRYPPEMFLHERKGLKNARTA